LAIIPGWSGRPGHNKKGIVVWETVYTLVTRCLSNSPEFLGVHHVYGEIGRMNVVKRQKIEPERDKMKSVRPVTKASLPPSDKAESCYAVKGSVFFRWRVRRS
jgi:hypothetical protein